MKKVLLFMIGILCALQVSAQNTDAMLFGDVKSKETGKHLPYATIKVKGSKRQTMCDGTGHFKLVNLPVGKLTVVARSEEHTSELQSRQYLVCRLLLEKKT